MPSSAKDRFTVDFEKIFFFVKQPNGYYFEQQVEDTKAKVIEPRMKKEIRQTASESSKYKGFQARTMTRNTRTVWSINTEQTSDAHFATYPQRLVEQMIKAGCPEDGIVLDPFFGSGTTGIYARKSNRNFLGIELNPEYVKIAENRLYKEIGMFL
jgi:site-specific DNA-methyltransferase (adenine-specific)